MKSESEFGKGLTYCLGLFLAHAERVNKSFSEKDRYGMWFNAAGDHVFDLQTEKAPNKSLVKRCKKFRGKVLTWRMEKATKSDFSWAIQEAKDLLRLIDRANNVPTQGGRWE